MLHFVFSCPSCVQLYELSQETVGESCSRGGGEERRRRRGNSNLGFCFSGNFYSQKAAVNDTRAVLKAKQINTLQDEDEIPRAIISGLNSNPYHPLTSSGKVENAA